MTAKKKLYVKMIRYGRLTVEEAMAVVDALASSSRLDETLRNARVKILQAVDWTIQMHKGREAQKRRHGGKG